jgi:hypothetical protein
VVPVIVRVVLAFRPTSPPLFLFVIPTEDLSPIFVIPTEDFSPTEGSAVRAAERRHRPRHTLFTPASKLFVIFKSV